MGLDVETCGVGLELELGFPFPWSTSISGFLSRKLDVEACGIGLGLEFGFPFPWSTGISGFLSSKHSKRFGWGVIGLDRWHVRGLQAGFMDTEAKSGLVINARSLDSLLTSWERLATRLSSDLSWVNSNLRAWFSKVSRSRLEWRDFKLARQLVQNQGSCPSNWLYISYACCDMPMHVRWNHLPQRSQSRAWVSPLTISPQFAQGASSDETDMVEDFTPTYVKVIY